MKYHKTYHVIRPQIWYTEEKYAFSMNPFRILNRILILANTMGVKNTL